LGKTPDGYPLKVADSLFASKEVPGVIRDRIAHAALLPDKTYKYSDLGFYLLKDLVQRVTDTSLEVLTAQHFYRRMGASSLGYHPLNRFSPERLMPTERDTVFRKQWIRGYVHDPGAALLGGVGGHAGLFSTANDAAKMMQMFLNGGVYGGERFLQQQTVEEFTAAPFARSGNRRGIGFDRPQNPPQPNGPTATGVSQRSFGHSGFTGTYVWADPVTGVQYVFLSNRVSPDASNNKLSASNLRTDVHQLLLESLGLGSQPPAFLAL
jgi:CubicO group peptidase (beta-lactamase class C family)